MIDNDATVARTNSLVLVFDARNAQVVITGRPPPGLPFGPVAMTFDELEQLLRQHLRQPAREEGEPPCR